MDSNSKNESLPKGFERRYDSKGRVYYVDHNTRTTSRVHPKDMDQLPNGWDMRETKTGRKYFVDHNTKKTTWLDPRLSG